ncbi:von Willebrand factor C domain-containing protein 2-like [Stegostoma tigrinum]|uniref:von Willebrand factor C domain-containing protein 2-like n=1 Tax=Stegostoma tigrinum TaxID=3053191 RepID=UPI00202B3D3B|nr:von Willebrand factor C domain-containing protein 2-like [Stegostoma tigrinum]
MLMAVLRKLSCLVLVCLTLTHIAKSRAASVNEILSKSDSDYVLSDYRGKGCIDDNGFVFDVGERFYPTATACPCVCTETGPVCRKPQCPRISSRCIRVSYHSCCPRCLEFRNSCQYGGKMYQLFQEFWPSACERCRCEANREVYCLTAECAPVHCVNPSYEPNQCCSVCKQGPNCFAGNTIIPAGVKVEMDGRSVCFCPYKDGSWEPQQQAICTLRGRRLGHHHNVKERHHREWIQQQ